MGLEYGTFLGINTPAGDLLRTHVEVTPLLDGLIWRVDARPLLERINPRWLTEMMEVASSAPEVVIQGGAVHTSMEDQNFKTIYQPTNGLVIAQKLPWLLRLYQNEFQQIVQKLSKDPTAALGSDLEHSLNLNYTLGGLKRKYELHRDRNPYTFLLGACDIKEGEGGRTLIYEDDGLTQIAAIAPKAGIGIVFNGHKPHRVEEYTGLDPRLVGPGDYYTRKHKQVVDKRFNDIILT